MLMGRHRYATWRRSQKAREPSTHALVRLRYVLWLMLWLAFGNARQQQHPSCRVGSALRSQGDLGEALLALEVCYQTTRSFAALLNLASVYIETGRVKHARGTLLKLVESAREADQSAAELCRAHVALLELRLASHAPDCISVATELEQCDAACANMSWSIARDASFHQLGADMQRVVADAALCCPVHAARAVRATTGPAEHAVGAAVAALASRPAAARRWRTLCFALFLAHGTTGHGGVERAGTESNGVRCWHTVRRLSGLDRAFPPPWECELWSAVAQQAESEGQGAQAQVVIARGAINHYVAAAELIGAAEARRLLCALPSKAPAGVRAAIAPATDALAWASSVPCGDGLGGRNLSAAEARARFGKQLGLSDGVRVVGLDWSLDPATGWGNYGLQLIDQLLRAGDILPLVLHAPSPALVKECRRVLTSVSKADGSHVSGSHVSRAAARAIMTQGSWVADTLGAMDIDGRRFGGGHPIVVDFVVVHAAKRFFFGENETVWGVRNVAVVFFEDVDDIQPHRRQRAHCYDAVVLGSTWAWSVVTAVEGSEYAPMFWRVHQGVRPEVFGPSRTHGREDESFRPFRIFSGGKLEHRKGQDIVLEAFRRFHQRHPQSQLITAWHNGFLSPSSKPGRDAAEARKVVAMHSPYVSDPVLGPDRAVQVSAWAEAHGLPRGAVVSADSFVLNIDSRKRSNGQGKNITGGYLSAGALVEVMRRCDAAVFLSRAEGGTNLMAMEAMAVCVCVHQFVCRRTCVCVCVCVWVCVFGCVCLSVCLSVVTRCVGTWECTCKVRAHTHVPARTLLHLLHAHLAWIRPRGRLPSSTCVLVGVNACGFFCACSCVYSPVGVFLQVGLPVVISNNTGHADIASSDWNFPVATQHDVIIGRAGMVGRGSSGAQARTGQYMSGRRMQGWGESDVVQAVEALTYIYRNPIAARRRGRRAADFVQVCSERHRRSFRACIHIFTLRFTRTHTHVHLTY